MAGLQFGGIHYCAGNETGARGSQERGFSGHPDPGLHMCRDMLLPSVLSRLANTQAKRELGADLAKQMSILPRKAFQECLLQWSTPSIDKNLWDSVVPQGTFPEWEFGSTVEVSL